MLVDKSLPVIFDDDSVVNVVVGVLTVITLLKDGKMISFRLKEALIIHH